jgi:hypothetical protein
MAARSESVTLRLSIVQYLCMAAIGSAVIQTTICVYNDICDVKYDALVGKFLTSTLSSGVLWLIFTRAYQVPTSSDWEYLPFGSMDISRCFGNDLAVPHLVSWTLCVSSVILLTR